MKNASISQNRLRRSKRKRHWMRHATDHNTSYYKGFKMEPVTAITLSLNILAVAFISLCTSVPTDTTIDQNGLVTPNNTEEQQQKQPISNGKFAVSISGKVTPRIFGSISGSNDATLSESGQSNRPQTWKRYRGGGRQQAGSSSNPLAAGPKPIWRPPTDKLPTSTSTPRTKVPSNRQPLLPLVLQKTLESIDEYKNSKNVKVSAIIIIEDVSNSDGSAATSKPGGSFGIRNNQENPSLYSEPADELQPQEQSFGATDMTNDGED